MISGPKEHETIEFELLVRASATKLIRVYLVFGTFGWCLAIAASDVRWQFFVALLALVACKVCEFFASRAKVQLEVERIGNAEDDER